MRGPAAKPIGRAIQSLENAATLPGPLDYEAAIPPTDLAWVRRVPNENIWIFYKVLDGNIVALVTITRVPPHPLL